MPLKVPAQIFHLFLFPVNYIPMGHCSPQDVLRSSLSFRPTVFRILIKVSARFLKLLFTELLYNRILRSILIIE